jgi:hypothetical protein
VFKSDNFNTLVLHETNITLCQRYELLSERKVYKGVKHTFYDKYNLPIALTFFPMALQPLGGLGRLFVQGFTITLRHTTLGRTPLDEEPARRRDL